MSPGEPCSRRAFRILLGSLRKECCQPLSFDPERRGGEGWKQQFMYGSSGWLNTLLLRWLAPLASIRRTLVGDACWGTSIESEKSIPPNES